MNFLSSFRRRPESLVFDSADSGLRRNDGKFWFVSRLAPRASYRVFLAFFLLFSFPVHAVIEDRKFADPVQAQRYQTLIEELRCPKCQNQNIADSDAEIAEDLRNEIYRQLLDGRSDKEIVDYLVARYGEFVNYRPPLDSNTLLLWSAPGVLLLLGVLIWWRRFANKKTVATEFLSAAEQQRLRELLQDADKSRSSSGESS